MTITDLRSLLDDMEALEGFGPDTEIVIDDVFGYPPGFQEPVFRTVETTNGPHLIVIQAPTEQNAFNEVL